MPPAVAARQRCSPVVEAKLGDLGIEHGRLAGVVYGLETTSGEGAEPIAVRAWISLYDCACAVIIRMRPDCRFVQASTTGSCKIAGLYHSCRGRGRLRHRWQRLAGLAAAIAVLFVGVARADGDDAAEERTPAKAERPTTLDRPIGLKPYFLSPRPKQVDPTARQRAVDYRSRLKGEIKRLERRQGDRRDRRSFDRGQSLRRERARIDRVIRR